jgi:hypothetical protein
MTLVNSATLTWQFRNATPKSSGAQFQKVQERNSKKFRSVIPKSSPRIHYKFYLRGSNGEVQMRFRISSAAYKGSTHIDFEKHSIVTLTREVHALNLGSTSGDTGQFKYFVFF